MFSPPTLSRYMRQLDFNNTLGYTVEDSKVVSEGDDIIIKVRIDGTFQVRRSRSIAVQRRSGRRAHFRCSIAPLRTSHDAHPDSLEYEDLLCVSSLPPAPTCRKLSS